MYQRYFKKKLLPAVTLSDANSALFVAEALLEGGINVMEVTFRSSETASAISAIAKKFPEMNIGAGTILSPDQVSVAKNAGAQFGLSPGLNEDVILESQHKELLFIPGVMTPSEIEKALSFGCKTLKLFPVSNLGGADYIQSLEGPYMHTGVKFLPMGGIHPSNLKPYLNCNSVIAVGGSWMTPKEVIAKGEFSKISEYVRKSLEIAKII